MFDRQEHKLENIINEIEELIAGSQYINYCFNRTRSPEISVDSWRAVFGDKTDQFEFLYQRERQLKS